MFPGIVGHADLAADPVAVGIARQHQPDVPLLGERPRRLGRPRTFRVGRAHGNRRERAVRFVTGWHEDGNPGAAQCGARGRQRRAAQRGEHDRRRGLRLVGDAFHDDVEVGVVQGRGDGADQAAREGFGERHDADVRGLGHDVGQALVVGGDRLAAGMVVHLDAVVVGRVVRGGQVEPARGAQLRDQKRKFGRGEDRRIVVRCGQIGDYPVARVDFARQLRQAPRRQPEQRMRPAQKRIRLRGVLKLAGVVGDDDRQFGSVGPRRAQIGAMSLHGHRQRGPVHAVRPVADTPAASAGAERQDLPERVADQRQVLFVQVTGQHIRLGIRHAARQPRAEPVRGVAALRAVGVDQAFGDAVEGGHEWLVASDRWSVRRGSASTGPLRSVPELAGPCARRKGERCRNGSPDRPVWNPPCPHFSHHSPLVTDHSPS